MSLGDELSGQIHEFRKKNGRNPVSMTMAQDHYLGLCAEEGKILHRFMGVVLLPRWGWVSVKAHVVEFEDY